MLDWNELLMIGAAAIVFIGPKELPGALRTMGKFVAKARTMAREFQTNVDDMVREAELDEVKRQVQKLEYGGLERMVQETVDPKGDLQKALEVPDLSAAMSSPSVSAPAAPAAPPPAVAAQGAATPPPAAAPPPTTNA